jgi:hypothetical protein
MHNSIKTKLIFTIITSLSLVLLFGSCGGSSEADISRGIKVSQGKLEDIESGLNVTGADLYVMVGR